MMAPFEYHRPRHLEDALQILARNGRQIKILAGGTDLVISMKQGLFEPEVVLDVKGLRDLAFIRYQPGAGLSIGALATITQVATSDVLIRHFPVLAQAAATVSGPNLRNMGTVGGNLCLDTRCYWYNQSYSWRVSCGFCLKKDGTVCHVAPGGKLCWAVYSGDLAPALMTLRAELKIAGPRGERRVLIESFYVNEGRAKFDLRPDEILTEVFVPPASADCFGSYQKFRIRGSVDYPLAGVAVVAKKGPDGRIHDVRAALTAVNPAPQLVPGVNSVFGQQGAHADLMEEVVRLALRSARPLKTSASTMEYRRHMLAVMLRRALSALLGG